MNYASQVVVCDPKDGTDRGGPVHWGETSEDGEAQPGSCPILLAEGCMWIEADVVAGKRPVCKICRGERKDDAEMKLWTARVRLYWPDDLGGEGSCAWGAAAHAETAAEAADLIEAHVLEGEVAGSRAEVSNVVETTDRAFLLE
ncbi:MAG TPA: hypothetical protein VNA25_30345 [Phycisphaerae bacterium]|nr:hypothetical protein [Phycisphaerae bacterium]